MSFNGITITEDDLTNAVFNMNYGGRRRPGACESREIARLMLTAPDLLQALESLLAHPTTADADSDEAQRCQIAKEQARAALAKAKGGGK